jgi:hypothetical protein
MKLVLLARRRDRGHERDARQRYRDLLATASDEEHRPALKLLPRFGHLSIREAYTAAMAEVSLEHGSSVLRTRLRSLYQTTVSLDMLMERSTGLAEFLY